jgi:hypothetical protein
MYCAGDGYQKIDTDAFLSLQLETVHRQRESEEIKTVKASQKEAHS